VLSNRFYQDHDTDARQGAAQVVAARQTLERGVPDVVVKSR
jgi:hypothetical protein